MTRREFEPNDELETPKVKDKEVAALEDTVMEIKFPSMWNATFPGVVIHELTHYVSILITRAEIVASALFAKGKAFVRFKPNTLFTITFIAIAPMVLGTIISVIFYNEFFNTLPTGSMIWSAFWLWLGFSTAMHAHSSKADLAVAGKALELMWKNKTAVDTIIILLLYVPVAYPLKWFAELRNKIFEGGQGSYAWAILLLIFAAGLHKLI